MEDNEKKRMTYFEQLVFQMRWAQRQWFASKQPKFLAESRRLEREVDRELARMKEEESQPSLFGASGASGEVSDGR
ncbi:MAG: hypothetical protein II943_00495 [Victivallales bacterium]|jgi:hypothetical protein|nr:hypothetical protein [Victivallales bacterium]